MTTLLQDVRFALRWLRRSPGFTATAVGSIAIAIGIYAALFAVVDALLLRPLPVRDAGRLVSLYTSGSDGEPWNTTSYPDLMDLRRQNAVFEDMAGHCAMIAAVNLADTTRLTLGEIVTGNYFQVLGVPAAVGRTPAADDARRRARRWFAPVLAARIRRRGGCARQDDQDARPGLRDRRRHAARVHGHPVHPVA
jgi:hypothetical protein